MKPVVKAVWLYGSVLRKKEFKKSSDIDIVVLVDDTSPEFNKQKLAKIRVVIEMITITAKEEGLQLHFQPPRRLTTWWELIRDGEPWTITSIKESMIVYDDSGYVEQLKLLLAKGIVYSQQERAEKLIERAYLSIIEARQISLTKLPHELLMITVETAQRVLWLKDKHPITPRDTIKELQSESLPSENADELYSIVRKINKGVLSEFSGADFDRHYKKTMKFVELCKKEFVLLEEKKKDKILVDSYNHSMELAKKAIYAQTKKKPQKDKEVLEEFSKLVKEGLIDEIHEQTLKDLIIYDETRDLKKIMHDRYIKNVYVKSLEIAIHDFLHYRKEYKGKLPSIKKPVKGGEILLKSLKKETDLIIKKHNKEIKAIWIITPDEILTNDDLTVMILVDDQISGKKEYKQIEVDCYKIEEEIRRKESVKIHSGQYKISEYFERVMKGDPEIFREIEASIPIYDPTGFFSPLKKLIKTGSVAGSRVAMENLELSIADRLSMIERYKLEIVERLSNAVICAGQAPLIATNKPVPHPRRVDEELIKNLGKQLPKYYAKAVEEVFEFYKSIEHKKIKKVSGQNLDRIFKKATQVYEKMESFISEMEK